MASLRNKRHRMGSSPRARPRVELVFIVHGRDDKARRALGEFLRAVKLQPLEWSELAGSGAPFVGEILERGFRRAQAVVVLLTGDDKARLRKRFLKKSDGKHERDLTAQPRPNVLFEAGMALGTHPTRTILVQIGKIRPFTDIAGRHFIAMDNSPNRRNELAMLLEGAGCRVDRGGTDWLNAGNFEYKSAKDD